MSLLPNSLKFVKSILPACRKGPNLTRHMSSKRRRTVFHPPSVTASSSHDKPSTTSQSLTSTNLCSAKSAKPRADCSSDQPNAREPPSNGIVEPHTRPLDSSSASTAWTAGNVPADKDRCAKDSSESKQTTLPPYPGKLKEPMFKYVVFKVE